MTVKREEPLLPEWAQKFEGHIQECTHDYCAAEDKPIRDLLEALTIAIKALQRSKIMTDELMRTMDEDHWYKDDLVDLRVRIIQALTRIERLGDKENG